MPVLTWTNVKNKFFSAYYQVLPASVPANCHPAPILPVRIAVLLKKTNFGKPCRPEAGMSLPK
jgi:hypothetical protein